MNKDGILSSKSYTGVWTGFALGWPLALHTEEPSVLSTRRGEAVVPHPDPYMPALTCASKVSQVRFLPVTAGSAMV